MDLRAALAARYAPFAEPAPPARPDLTITVAVRAAPVGAEWKPRYVTHPGAEPLPHPPDYDADRDGPLVPYETQPISGGLRLAAGATLRAELDAGRGQAWIVQAPSIYLFHTALRQFLAYLLPFGDGCLLHAAGAILDGRAVGFFGVSGSGKSTLARLAPGPVLTDESLGLTDESLGLTGGPGGWLAHATPFWGDYDPTDFGFSTVDFGKRSDERVSQNPNSKVQIREAPLAALFAISHGPDDRVTPLAWPDAVRALSGSLMYRLPAPDYEAALLRQAAALARAVPCFRLAFAPTPAVWDCVRAALPAT